MKILLDTCVLIDIMRGYPQAITFFEDLDHQPYISVITVAELYAGAKNKKKKQLSEKMIQNCIILDLTPEIAEKGGEWSCQFTPSHGTDLPDALIAATAHVHHLVFATCNIKHFPMFPDIKKPY